MFTLDGPLPNPLPRIQGQKAFGGRKNRTQSSIESLYGHGIKSPACCDFVSQGIMHLSINNNLLPYTGCQV